MRLADEACGFAAACAASGSASGAQAERTERGGNWACDRCDDEDASESILLRSGCGVSECCDEGDPGRG